MSGVGAMSEFTQRWSPISMMVTSKSLDNTTGLFIKRFMLITFWQLRVHSLLLLTSLKLWPLKLKQKRKIKSRSTKTFKSNSRKKLILKGKMSQGFCSSNLITKTQSANPKKMLKTRQPIKLIVNSHLFLLNWKTNLMLKRNQKSTQTNHWAAERTRIKTVC